MEPKSIAFHHFGCKVNFAEASSLSREFKENGFALKDFHEVADVYVISTCVVTSVAEKKCRAAIRQAHHLNPEARIAVIGCFPELMPEELEKMEGVSLVLGHSAKFNLFSEIDKLFHPDHYGHTVQHGPGEFIASYSYGDRTRSFVKIQDGCDYYCSYCTIPLARGHSRSDTTENVLKNVREAMNAGAKEIVLTGVNIGDFGRNTGERFTDLVEALDGIKELLRIRISSIEPDLLNNDIIERIAVSSKFMPHFHIPLQSGSASVLKRMKRKYTKELYLSKMETIRRLLPNACIAADVIVGFPGESDEEFRETYDFITSLPLSYLHVFSYSKRPNTLAAGMETLVNDKVKKQRSDILHKLSDEKKKSFYQFNKGKLSRVLFESDNNEGWMHGFSENYIKVKTRYNESLINRIREVEFIDYGNDFCYTVELGS
jgi:threonylcarbamoyladenosine tRNA methylthiotransferase MtaB